MNLQNGSQEYEPYQSPQNTGLIMQEKERPKTRDPDIPSNNQRRYQHQLRYFHIQS